MIIFNHKYWWLKCLKPKNAHRRIITIVLNEHDDRIKTHSKTTKQRKRQEETKNTSEGKEWFAQWAWAYPLQTIWGNSRITMTLTFVDTKLPLYHVIINEGHQNSAAHINISMDWRWWWWFGNLAMNVTASSSAVVLLSHLFHCLWKAIWWANDFSYWPNIKNMTKPSYFSFWLHPYLVHSFIYSLSHSLTHSLTGFENYVDTCRK